MACHHGRPASARRAARGSRPEEQDSLLTIIEIWLDGGARPAGPVLTVQAAAELFGVEPGDVVRSLKAGAPTVGPGDPHTGDEARLRSAPRIEWCTLVGDRLADTGNDRPVERLSLPR